MEDTFLNTRLSEAEQEPGPAETADADRSPMYKKIYTQLKQRIEGGSLAPGDLVPSEQELCEHYDVSRVTARRALNELAASGLVVRQRGRGTQVLSAAHVAPYQTNISELLRGVEQLGRSTSVKTTCWDRISAGADIARALQLSPRDKVKRCVRLRSLGNASMARYSIAMPMDVAELLPDIEVSQTPVIVALMRANLSVSSANQVVTAASAPEDIADALQIPAGSALIEERRVIYGQGGRPILYTHGYYRPEYYQFELRLQQPLA